MLLPMALPSKKAFCRSREIIGIQLFCNRRVIKKQLCSSREHMGIYLFFLQWPCDRQKSILQQPWNSWFLACAIGCEQNSILKMTPHCCSVETVWLSVCSMMEHQWDSAYTSVHCPWQYSGQYIRLASWLPGHVLTYLCMMAPHCCSVETVWLSVCSMMEHQWDSAYTYAQCAVVQWLVYPPVTRMTRVQFPAAEKPMCGACCAMHVRTCTCVCEWN